MRLNEQLRQIIKKREDEGLVWLSRLSPLALQRFRWKTRKGFTDFVKDHGLTFISKELMVILEEGWKFYETRTQWQKAKEQRHGKTDPDR